MSVANARDRVCGNVHSLSNIVCVVTQSCAVGCRCRALWQEPLGCRVEGRCGAYMAESMADALHKHSAIMLRARFADS